MKFKIGDLVTRKQGYVSMSPQMRIAPYNRIVRILNIFNSGNHKMLKFCEDEGKTNHAAYKFEKVFSYERIS